MRKPSRLLLALTLVAAGVLMPAGGAGAAEVTTVSNKVDIRCAFLTYKVNSDWTFPAGNPRGLVWLQHGFSRANNHVRELGSRYAQNGFVVFSPTIASADIFGCTLQNIGNNTAWLNNIADLFGKAADPGDKLGRSFADAANRAGRPGLAIPQKFVFAGHSAGGEAASYVAQRLRAAYPAQAGRLAGLTLLDPVASVIGNNLSSSLGQLNNAALPIATISSPGYTCNSDANGTTVLQQQVHRPWVGVRLTTGCHCDVEAGSTDALCTGLCGNPQAHNVAALQRLATGWAVDHVTGGRTPDLYPGGSYYDSLVTGGTITSLAGAA